MSEQQMTTRVIEAASIGDCGSVCTAGSRDGASLEGGSSTSNKGEKDRNNRSDHLETFPD